MRMVDSPVLLRPCLRESRALDMHLDDTRKCDECGSQFFPNVASMSGLCPECAHWLYGKPNCLHEFVVGVDRRYCRVCG